MEYRIDEGLPQGTEEAIPLYKTEYKSKENCICRINGKMKGTNLILPLVADDFDTLISNYIRPFEEAGYNVRAKFLSCDINASMSRNIARELETGRIINSSVVFSFGEKPEQVYKKIAPMINSKGLPYAIED